MISKEEFWMPLITNDKGELDKEKILAELFDFHECVKNWSNALYELTGGNLSKPNYTSDVIINAVTNYFEDNDDDK